VVLPLKLGVDPY